MGRRERLVLLLKFREQPYILDCDHGLGGESLHQRDLLVRELPDLSAPQSQHADRFAITQHRDRQHCAKPQRLLERTLVVGRLSDVGDMYGSTLDDRATCRPSSCLCSRICSTYELQLAVRHIVLIHESQPLTVESDDGPPGSVA